MLKYDAKRISGSMNESYELVICIDKDALTSRVLETGTIEQIDSFTIKFESSDEIRYLYQDTINGFISENIEHIKNIRKKTKRRENGDIALIRTTEHERKRIKVIYKKHIEVFKMVIIDHEFVEYLKENYQEYYNLIKKYIYKEIIIERETSILIRKIYEIYKEYAKANNKTSPDKLYQRKKEKNQDESTGKIDTYILDDIKERRGPLIYKSWSRGK